MTRRRIVVKLLNRDGFVQHRIGLVLDLFKTYDLSPLDSNADENVQESVTFSYNRIEELPLTDADKTVILKWIEDKADRARIEAEKNKDAAYGEYARLTQLWLDTIDRCDQEVQYARERYAPSPAS